MFGKNQYQLYGKVGEPVQLNMYAKANPHGTYTWSKDDGTDISNATIQDDDLDQTNLTFPMFSVPYFGNYTLKMENRIGTNYAHYQILADGEWFYYIISIMLDTWKRNYMNETYFTIDR
jgi:hypothetical protein